MSISAPQTAIAPRFFYLVPDPTQVSRLHFKGLMCLRAIQPKNSLPKASDGRADRPLANLFAQRHMATKPNEAWAGDITFIPATSRWLYLAMVIDLGSRRIIGWSLDTHMRSELVVRALQQALQARPQA